MINNNKEKLKFFEDNGYIILENIFSEKDCDNAISEAKKLVQKNIDFTPIMHIHKSSKLIKKLMAQEDLLEFINEYFQSTALGLQTEFFFMPPDTVGFNPHQDNTYVRASPNSFISAWCALTDVNENNGGLIVWPKTHKEEYLQAVDTGNSKASNQDPSATSSKTLIPKKYNEITPTIKKGSVLMIHSWLVHASNTNRSNKNRYALLCTYIKRGADFRAGNYAKRTPFEINL